MDALDAVNLTQTSFLVPAWGKIYRMTGENDMLMFCAGTWIAGSVPYWITSLSLLYIDITKTPRFLWQYKVQPDKNAPLDISLLPKLFKTVFINMIIMLPIVAVIWYQLCQWRGLSCGYDVPTLPRILFDLIAAIICEEIFFYYSHRLFHHPYIYKRVHKKHHEWTAPIGLVAVYAHPIEHVLCNIIPVFSGSLIFGSHLLSVWLWLFVAMWGTTIHHSGYHFPLLLSSEFHDFHHLKFNYCFGLLGVLDYLHGTDVLFRKSKASKRHKTLFGITPLSKSIPDEKQ